jgi:hypothetical protein
LADDEEEGEEEETKENVIPSITAGGAAAACIFTSQGPDATQDISNVKDFELRNLLSLPQDRQDKAVCDLFRVVLFRAHQMEPIDRAKCLKEAGIAQYRVSSAVFQEVETRLQNLFGYSLRRVPKFMEKMKGLPANIKDRYYVINTIEDPSGQHSVRGNRLALRSGFFCLYLTFLMIPLSLFLSVPLVVLRRPSTRCMAPA